ncbi:MAG: DUF3604 domain-containing protein, partial [Chitinophagaceae bacterium]
MRSSIFAFIFSILFVACNNSENNNVATSTDSTNKIETTAAANIPQNPLKEAYFGETHLHTAYSLDAYIGGARLRPEDAYRFAMGEEVSSHDVKMKLHVPLDFCALTDHAEYIGEMYSMMTPGAPGYDHEATNAIRNAKTYEEAMGLFVKYVAGNNRGAKPQHPEFFQGFETTKSGWKEIQAAAEKYNKPGTFTTLHAFEWSSAPGGSNLHRNIIFRTNKVTDQPMSSYEIPREEELWEWLKKENESGHKVLAIPHNSNASKGLMFNEVDSKGKPIDAEYAKMRQEYEPLIEMMQIKGNSEVVPRFWANDEFADFENASTMEKYSGRTFLKKNFVRYGLEKGLLYQEQIGVNPYKYGFVGGTDNHNGLPGNTEDDNYMVGSHGLADLTAKNRATLAVDGWAEAYDINPGALCGVWAPSNTRENIWDAMNSRETFATSGVRIKVRFFAGYDFAKEYVTYEELVKAGYQNGVPMGGDLPLKDGKKPSFLVWAMKDPLGPNLDRIQIVKGWVEKGVMKEKVFNVAVSDNRVIKADGSVAKLDAQIDMKTGAFNKDKGSIELKATWTDPGFDPAQHAFYYVRVLQLPTARWTFYDELREGVTMPKSVSKSIIERAWSSPIWFT